MESARNAGRAAVARAIALLCAMLFSSVLGLAQPVKKTTTKKKTAAPSATKRVSSKSSRTTPTATRRSVHEAAVTGTPRAKTRKVVVTRRLVHGHWVRTTQVVHATPGPTFQPHPDPERYSQIQQALATSGYYKGQVNGQWGDDSVAALKQFQTDHKLVNDGRISSLSLIGLGLGPNRETASATPAKDAAESTPPAAIQPVEPVHN